MATDLQVKDFYMWHWTHHWYDSDLYLLIITRWTQTCTRTRVNVNAPIAQASQHESVSVTWQLATILHVDWSKAQKHAANSINKRYVLTLHTAKAIHWQLTHCPQYTWHQMQLNSVWFQQHKLNESHDFTQIKMNQNNTHTHMKCNKSSKWNNFKNQNHLFFNSTVP